MDSHKCGLDTGILMSLMSQISGEFSRSRQTVWMVSQRLSIAKFLKHKYETISMEDNQMPLVHMIESQKFDGCSPMDFWRHGRTSTAISIRWTAEYGTKALLFISHIMFRRSLNFRVHKIMSITTTDYGGEIFQFHLLVLRVGSIKEQKDNQDWRHTMLKYFDNLPGIKY